MVPVFHNLVLSQSLSLVSGVLEDHGVLDTDPGIMVVPPTICVSREDEDDEDDEDDEEPPNANTNPSGAELLNSEEELLDDPTSKLNPGLVLELELVVDLLLELLLDVEVEADPLLDVDKELLLELLGMPGSRMNEE